MGIRKLKDHINGGNMPQDPTSKLTDYLNQTNGSDIAASGSMGDSFVEDYGQKINNSDFLDDGFSYKSPYDADEIRAQSQPWLSKTASGIARVGVKVAAEVAKMPGIMGGVIVGAGGQLQDAITGEDSTDFVQTAFNNGWVKAVANTNEKINHELLPVYVRKSVEEGNLWDNITSMDFWANEGADGIGYILSMLVPGAVINKLSLGSHLTKTGASLFKGGTRYANMSRKVDDAAAAMSKIGQSGLPTTAKNIDLWSATMANTMFEAAAEAQGAMEGYEASLSRQFENGEIDSKEYEELLANKSKVGRDIFVANTAILLGPNAIMSKMLWGKPRNKPFKGIKTDGSKLVAQKAPTMLGKAKDLGIDLAKATGREGFFEEGLQTTTEQYVSSAYENNEKYDVGEYAKAYVDMLDTTEGQKAIFLGAVLGGGMQMYTGAKSRKREREVNNKLVELGNDTIQDVFKVLNEDIYKRDKEGKIIYKNGKPVLDEVGVIEKLTGSEELEKLSLRYDMATENGDTKTAEAIRDVMVTNLIIPFVANEQLGLETLRQHLQQSSELAGIEAREGKQKGSLIEDIMRKAEYLKDASVTFDDFGENLIQLDHKDATEDDYRKYYNRLSVNYLANKSKLFSAEKRLEEENQKLDRVLKEKGISRVEAEENSYEGIKKRDLRLKLALSNVKQLESEIAEINSEIEDMWDSNISNTGFSKFVNARKKIEKEVAEESPKAEETVEEIKKATSPEEVDDAQKGKKVSRSDEEQKQYDEEESLVKEITDSVNSDPSIKNLKRNLERLKGVKFDQYSAAEVIESIEKGIEQRVKAQQEFAKYLETIETSLTSGLEATKEKIDKLNSDIARHKKRRDKIKADLAKEDKAPKGRNAKIIKQLIAETEKEITTIDKLIDNLEKSKNKLQDELDDTNKKLQDLVKASEYITERWGQIENLDFTSVKDVIDFIKKSADIFEDHRFDLQRLATHKFYTEQNVQALEDIIEHLTYYKQSLLDSIKSLKEGDPNEEFILDEIGKTTSEMMDLKKELATERKKLDRLDKSFKSKEILDSLAEELKFWEQLQETKYKHKVPRYLANPIVNEAAIKRKRELEEKKKQEEEKRAKEAEVARKQSELSEEAKEAGVTNKATYVAYIRDNFNQGEQVPPPPKSVKLSKNIREKEGANSYTFVNSTDKGINLEIGGTKVFIKEAAEKDDKGVTTTEPSETGEKPEATKPLYNTEGGVNEEFIEEGDNLPKDKDGNVIKETLETVENDARIITGTDLGNKLDFIPQAAVDFERRARNKKNETVHFEINKSYTKGKQGEALKLLEKDNLTPADIEFLINHLPINVVLNKDIPDAKAPLETLNENPNLAEEDRKEYNRIFAKSSKELRTAIIKEMVLNNTSIENITTTIAGQKNGSIQVAPKKNGKVQENSLLHLHKVEGKMSNIKASDIYVVNDQGRLENYQGKFFGSKKRLHPGEIYYIIETAAGMPFPLKLNVKKVTKPEAELLYEIYKHRFNVGIEKGKGELLRDTNSTIVELTKKVFKKELEKGGLFDRNDKPFEDLSIKDVVDFLIWDGTKSKKSQVRFDSKHIKVMGKIYTKEEFMSSREAFIDALTSAEKGKGKRRNISFKRKRDQESTAFNFENRSYLEYLIENKILNTNALADETYPPTFQGDTTIYLKTNNVRVSKGPDVVLSEYNVAKTITQKNTLRGTTGMLKRKQPGLFKREVKLNQVQTNLYRKAEIDPKTGKKHEFKSKLVTLTPTQLEYLKPEEKKLYTQIPLNHYYDNFGNFYQRVTHVTAEKEANMSAARYYNAAKRGDVVDALIRDYFSRGYKDMDAFVKDGKKKLDQVNRERTKHGDIHITPNAFRELYHVMQEYEIEFQKRGYTVYSTTEPLWGNLKKGGKIVRAAGSMDLLVQDNKGRFIIIDIKTSTVDRAEDYESSKSMYKEKDRRQQNAYRELFRQQTKEPIHKILIMPITIRAKKDEGEINSVYRNITRTKAPTGFIEVDMSQDIFEIMGETPISSEDKRQPGKFKKKAQTGFASSMREMQEEDQFEPTAAFGEELEGVEGSFDDSGMVSVGGIRPDELSATLDRLLAEGYSLDEAYAKIEKGEIPSKKKAKPEVVKTEYPSSLTKEQGIIYSTIKKEVEKEGFSVDENIAALNAALEQTTGENVEAKNTRKAISKLIEEYKSSKKEPAPVKKPTITKKKEAKPTFTEAQVAEGLKQLDLQLKSDPRSDEEKLKSLKEWMTGNVGDVMREAMKRKIQQLQGISEEEIRKSEEDSVSLQKMEDMIKDIDVSKMSDSKADVFIKEIMRTKSLRGLGREIRTITKEEGTPQETLDKILQLLAEKAEANEDVKTICRNIKNS